MKAIKYLLAVAVMFPIASQAVDFETEILPILEDNCLDCHGPDKQKSEFRVDERAIMLKGGDSGLAALTPGDAAGSYLIEVINGSDPDMLMPPKGDPLTAEQVALVEKWIEEGASSSRSVGFGGPVGHHDLPHRAAVSLPRQPAFEH